VGKDRFVQKTPTGTSGGRREKSNRERWSCVGSRMEYDGSRRGIGNDKRGDGSLGEQIEMRMRAAGSLGCRGRGGGVVMVLGGLR